MHRYHKDILKLIKEHSGKPTQHTFSDSYLGNSHPRYPISMPTLRKLAKEWMQAHSELSAQEFSELLTSLVAGESATEKCMAGIMLDYSKKEQRQFDPILFDLWLEHLEGWAEVDTVCTAQYMRTELLDKWKSWKPLLAKLAKSDNINKRRASLVLLCPAVRHANDERLAAMAFSNIEKLKSQKEILITKAISWLMRSLVRHYKTQLATYLEENKDSLPKIAVRETMIKLKTGKKTKRSTKK